MLMFKADFLNATDQQCDPYVYWKNNSVSTKSVATVSIKRTYFHFKYNESFRCIKYILQSPFDNKYQGLLLYYKSKNISSTPVIASLHKNSYSLKPYYCQSNNYMRSVAKQVAVKCNPKATYTVMS
jgi:hypothetical protein